MKTKFAFNRITTTLISALLALSLSIPASFAFDSQQAYAEEPEKQIDYSIPYEGLPIVERVPTKVNGLVYEKALTPNSKMANSITVSPAYGRKVELQRKSASGKWKTIGKYTSANTRTAKIKITYPAKYWKSSKRTTWRVFLPETETAESFTSKNVLLYTKNRKALTLSAKSAVVMNSSTGRVLYSKGMNVRRDQASLTKIMTGILAIENNKLDKKVRITSQAANTDWSYVPISRGNKVTVKNLLYAAMLISSNGSATALAQATSGSVSKFARLMNKKAKEIGLNNTHFVNAHGLTAKNHYSSAYDCALLMSYAIKNKTFKQITGTRRFIFRNSTTKEHFKLQTSNRFLLHRVRGVIGGKTGTTNAAGNCFACVYKHNGQIYVSVVLGSKTTDKRFNDTDKLLKYVKKYGW